jgi:hypothetical protein
MLVYEIESRLKRYVETLESDSYKYYSQSLKQIIDRMIKAQVTEILLRGSRGEFNYTSASKDYITRIFKVVI